MEVKEQTIFRELSQQDFGLRNSDTDAHVPQFFMISKTLPKAKPTRAPAETTTSKSNPSTPTPTPRSQTSYTSTDTTRHLHISSKAGQDR